MKKTFLLVFISVFILVACSPSEKIRVVVTPTPDPNVPTFTPQPTLEPTATLTLPPSSTPPPTATQDTTIPESTDSANTLVAPAIGEGYVLPTLAPPATVLVDIPTGTPLPIPTGTTVNPVTPTPAPQVTAGPSPTALPQLDANRMGIQVDPYMEYDQFEQVVGHLNGLGVRWVKMQIDWGRLQPDGPNDFNATMQLLEQQIELIDRSGINVLLSIAKAPAWARLTDQQEDGTPDDPQQLADFIAFLLSTKIGPIVDAIEVWNEPNLVREWRGSLAFSGAGYMQLFAPAYNAIRAYSQSMVILTAGLAPTSNLGTDAVDDRDFLRQMYANGLGNYQDIAIAVHPYGWGNAPDARCCGSDGWDEFPHFYYLSNIEDLRQIMVDNGHENLQMWGTEFGWATWDGVPNDPPEPWMRFNTAQEQSDFAIRAFEIAQATSYMGPMILWNLNFANEPRVIEQRDERTAYSVLNPAIFPSERPLYWALARATGAFAP